MSRKRPAPSVDQLDLFAASSPAAEAVLELFPEVELQRVLPSPRPSPSQGEGDRAAGDRAAGDRAAGDRDTGDTEIRLPAGLRLERNLAILAGAGAGKTYSLVTMCLHLLGGARTGFPPIACAELGLLTFTEKAADEMRSRLRERLDALAEGKGDEPALRESFDAAGLTFPPQRKWRSIRDELGAATIGTFHSVCIQLLRRAPPNSGVSPHFELLDERDARALLRDLVERTLLARIERDTPLRTLVAEIGFDRLVEGLAPIATRIREEGVRPDYVQVADGPTLRARFEAELIAFKGQLRNAPARTPQQRERHPEAMRAVLTLSFDTFEAGNRQLGEALKKVHEWQPIREAAIALSQTYAAGIVAPFEAEVRELLVDIATAHEGALSARGVLDFTGLLVQARNLLRDSPEARIDAQDRFKALLVDEFQDTNRLQLELVLLLAEKREGRARPVSQAFEVQHREIVQLPQQPGFLAVVGDRKQSIYEFRGADVSVFEVMARAIEANGGGRAYLRQSRRSTAPLLDALNAGFTQVLGPAAASSPPKDFEVVYAPAQDDLSAVRQRALRGVPLLQLENSKLGPDKLDAEHQRAADADAVSKAVSHGLSGGEAGWTVLSGKPELERPARGGDVAMLFQRFTQLEVYRQALVRHGVRHRVVRGRGFYGAQEIVDLASLLAVLADPGDAISLSAVLRSPLVGLTDAQWVGLARPTGGAVRWGLDARSVLLTEGLEVPEPVAVFKQRYAALRVERDRLGLRALLRVVLEVFEYRVAVAAGPFGEQGLANLDKLLVLATARESSGIGVAAFARELLELADDAPKEAQGEVIDELDLEAVTLCTVHQAKGLEWPIVVMPDLPTLPRNETAAVRFDRTLGLSLVRPRGTTDLRSRSATDISTQLQRRARAENLRLLYVAMTRARDRLVLGLRPTTAPANTWAAELAAFFTLRVSGERPEHLDVSTLTVRKPEPPPALPGAREEIDALVAQVRAPGQSSTAAIVLPVTQLEDLAACPRRFHFAHQVGLIEDRVAVGHDVALQRADRDEDVREQGTTLHRVLELTPLGAVGTPALGPALRQLSQAAGLSISSEALGWVERFWRSAFARSLAGAKVHRELPFALRLTGGEGPSLVLRGAIDLLVVTPTELLVIDYKTSTRSAAGLEPYRFQLGCYALAAQRFLPGARSVRAGVVFLREESPEPQFLGGLEPRALTAALLEQSAGLAQAQRTGDWPGRPRERCEALGCGYVYRCHP